MISSSPYVNARHTVNGTVVDNKREINALTVGKGAPSALHGNVIFPPSGPSVCEASGYRLKLGLNAKSM